MNKELFKTNLNKIDTIEYIVYSVITLGIYQCVWVFSRKNSLNKIAGSKISDVLVIIYIITLSLSVILTIFSKVYISWGNIFEIMQGVRYGDYAVICSLVTIILQIVISFSMKNILKEFSENNSMQWSIYYSSFNTFMLNYIYINYKINETIDHISQNLTTDKEETTSGKNLETSEDRLQKIVDMKEKGLINEDDFNSKKEEILKEI